MKSFKNHGYRALETYQNPELNHMIHVANKQYHAFLETKTPPTLTDHEFDIVKEYVKGKYNKPGNVYLGTVHRLDRPTTGLVIFAKTSKVLPRLNKLFLSKDIQKTYWAIVKNQPSKPEDTLINWLKKNPKNNKSYAYSKEIKDSKKAILHYKTLKKLDNYDECSK